MKKLLLLFSLLLLTLSACDDVVRKTPLSWCLWEIHKHENYDCEWSYVYNNIYNYDGSNEYGLDAYYITVFTDNRIGEWYCFIKCQHNNLFDRAIDRKNFALDEVLLIDCDLAREELL